MRLKVLSLGLRRVLCVAVVSIVPSAVHAQNAAITYQGRLDSGGVVYSGTADFRLALFDAPTAGTQVGPAFIAAAASVHEGLFTVRPDFGVAAFAAQRYLEISVRTPAWDGQGPEPDFFTFPDRPPITAAPYALQTRGLFVDASEHVGIGTDTPTTRLHVVGGTTLDGLLDVTQRLTAGGGAQVFGSTLLFGSLQANGPVTLNNTLNVNAPASFLPPANFTSGLSAVGPVNAGGPMQVGGLFTANGSSSFVGPAVFAGQLVANGGVQFPDGSQFTTARPDVQLLRTQVLIDPPLVLSGTVWVNSWGLPGAEVGDPVQVGYTLTSSGSPLVIRRAFVSSPGVVTIQFVNDTILPYDPPQFLARILVFRW